VKKAKPRPTLLAISDEMKAWSAAIVAEISDWPQVSVRSFFEFTALYCKDKMFAALPRTRAIQTANSLAFRLESPVRAVGVLLEKTTRPWSAHSGKARWFSYEIHSDAGLHDALDWLGKAYAAVGNKANSLTRACDRNRIGIYFYSNERSNEPR
jgi:hypothetical protein